MKILVIGSNSFSGSSFITHTMETENEVMGISRSVEAKKSVHSYAQKSKGRQFRFLQADLNDMSEENYKAIFRFRPKLVVNFAAQSMVAPSWNHPEDWYNTNIVSLSKLVSRLATLDSMEKYVHVTTPEVYGSTANWISEGEVFNPSTPYAVSRAAGDLHLRVMQKEKGFPVVFTRAANVYGSSQQLYRVIPKAFLSALTDTPFPLHGGGTSRRSFIHISDVSRATFQIAQEGAIGEDYHISTSQLITIRELVEKIYLTSGKTLELDNSIAEERAGKDAGYFLDSRKLESELNWRSLISIEEGLDEVGTWVKLNLESFRNMSWEYVHKK